MGHTNSTANLSLPQFIGTDKPTWLGDVNGAFSAIDAYAGTNDAAVAAAVSDASSAISQASSAVNTANTANTTAGNASTAANNAVGVANNAVAIAGTVDSKVGLLADLHTTDRTSIVNAINEIADGAGSVYVIADGIKTNSALLDELHALIDVSKLTRKAQLVIDSDIVFEIRQLSQLTFYNLEEAAAESFFVGIKVLVSGSTYYRSKLSDQTFTNMGSQVPTSGVRIELFY